jgi:mono/diheme cytochrome c family protein
MKRILLLALMMCGCEDETEWPNTVNAVRGKYLVTTVGSCGDCHTTPQASGLPSFDPADFLAGGRAFIVPFGNQTQKFFAKNLTSDKETGLGDWTDAEIKRAITHGIRKNGDALFPIMPYYLMAHISDNDLESIVRFLRTLPAKKNMVPEDTFLLSEPAKPIDENLIPRTTLAASHPDYEKAVRGRYLAGETGACLGCHTPHTEDLNALLDMSKAFAGGDTFDLGTFTVRSSNLTPDITGLSGWTKQDLIATVQFAKERGTGRAICPPMPAGPNRLGDMTPGDLDDIATYLTTLAPVSYGPFGCDDAGVPIGLDIP